jgi:hypothetical protein
MTIYDTDTTEYDVCESNCDPSDCERELALGAYPMREQHSHCILSLGELYNIPNIEVRCFVTRLYPTKRLSSWFLDNYATGQILV